MLTKMFCNASANSHTTKLVLVTGRNVLWNKCEGAIFALMCFLKYPIGKADIRWIRHFRQHQICVHLLIEKYLGKVMWR